MHFFSMHGTHLFETKEQDGDIGVRNSGAFQYCPEGTKSEENVASHLLPGKTEGDDGLVGCDELTPDKGGVQPLRHAE